MPWSFKKEIQRKILHLLASLAVIIIIIFVSMNFGKQIALLSLVFFLILLLILEFWRLELKGKVPLVCSLFRDKEKDKLGGQIFLLIGGIIAYAVFDYRIALAAVLMTGFGDLVSSLVGKLGNIQITKERNFEGILAEFVVDLGIAFFLINGWQIILIMALTATFLETISNEIDDNFLIPIVAGFVAQAISKVF